VGESCRTPPSPLPAPAKAKPGDDYPFGGIAHVLIARRWEKGGGQWRQWVGGVLLAVVLLAPSLCDAQLARTPHQRQSTQLGRIAGCC